jgi:hypothetical protein
MFIVESNLDTEIKVLLRGVKQSLGHVPPHFELFASVNPTRFKMFMQEIGYLSKHAHINPDFFALLRYYVASKNGFNYCIKFNHALLLSKEYRVEQLSMLEVSAKNVPLDERHQALFLEAVNALDNPEDFTAETLEKLNALGWSDADIFDAVDHGAFLFKFSKILRAYSKD